MEVDNNVIWGIVLVIIIIVIIIWIIGEANRYLEKNKNKD